MQLETQHIGRGDLGSWNRTTGQEPRSAAFTYDTGSIWTAMARLERATSGRAVPARDDGQSERTEDVCLDTQKNSTGQDRASSNLLLRDQGASLADYLVSKAPKEHVDVREPGYLATSANIGL
jgi:hypothetical protein